MSRARKHIVVNGLHFRLDKIISRERGDRLKKHPQIDISFKLKSCPSGTGYRYFRRCKS